MPPASGKPTTSRAGVKRGRRSYAYLKADGYTNVQITEHAKDHVDVKATKNGKTEKLAVNRETGTVKPDDDND